MCKLKLYMYFITHSMYFSLPPFPPTDACHGYHLDYSSIKQIELIITIFYSWTLEWIYARSRTSHVITGRVCDYTGFILDTKAGRWKVSISMCCSLLNFSFIVVIRNRLSINFVWFFFLYYVIVKTSGCFQWCAHCKILNL